MKLTKEVLSAVNCAIWNAIEEFKTIKNEDGISKADKKHFKSQIKLLKKGIKEINN